MYAVTPVENQFLLEYMPSAKADYVKVYLYGLMECAHRDSTLDAARMAQLLNLREEDVLAAYRYWERKGLVRRISDKPPTWQYLSCIQRMLQQPATLVDERYADFCESLQSAFGSARTLTGGEMSLAYEWVEELGLPEGVVLMMVQHLMATRGKKFSFKAAEKLAMQLRDENVVTIEDAENVLSRSLEITSGCRKVLRRLGQRREPSEDELELYARWVQAWGFSPDAVLAACAETVGGKPNFKYLDGVLKGIRSRNGALTSPEDFERVKAENDAKVEPLKEVLAALGNSSIRVNDETLRLYEEMAAAASHEVILKAARICAGTDRATLDQVRKGVEAWQARGLATPEEVDAYLEAVRSEDAVIDAVYAVWDRKPAHTQANREAVRRWKEAGVRQDALLYCAELAKEADKPFAYLTRLVDAHAAAGRLTAEAMRQEHEAHAGDRQKTGKKVPEQQYTQRTYEKRGHQADDWLVALAEGLHHDAQ